MSRSLYFFISLFLVCLFISCKKNNNSPKVLIVGHWNLTRLALKGYSNNVLQSDTTFTISNSFTNYVEFDKNSSFVDGIHAGIIDTTRGTYQISGMNLSFSNISGNANVVSTPYPIFFDGSFGNTEATSGTSSSNIITQITATNLTIHSETIIKVSSSVTDKTVFDQYYSK